MTLAEFNSVIQAAGLPCELVKGEGYFYFITTPDLPYRSKSEYYVAFNHLRPDQWAALARAFANSKEG